MKYDRRMYAIFIGQAFFTSPKWARNRYLVFLVSRMPLTFRTDTFNQNEYVCFRIRMHFPFQIVNRREVLEGKFHELKANSHWMQYGRTSDAGATIFGRYVCVCVSESKKR